MLDNAYKYEQQIREAFYNVWYDPKYQYYSGCGSFGEFNLDHGENGDYLRHVFASVTKDGELNGIISYRINRLTKSVNSFGAINFSENKIEYGRDLLQAVDNIFCKFGMNRLEFCVIIGNPVERAYDRLVKRAGGRILCIKRDTAVDMSGKYCDDKVYEIMREDYLKAKASRKKKNSLKTFKRDYLVNNLDLPWSDDWVIEDKIIDQSRWSLIHELVFRDIDGECYKTEYRIGATEMQDEYPWMDQTEVACIRVEKKPIVVEQWVAI